MLRGNNNSSKIMHEDSKMHGLIITSPLCRQGGPMKYFEQFSLDCELSTSVSKGGKTNSLSWEGLAHPVASVKIPKWKQSCRSAQKMTVIFGIFGSMCVFLNIAILFACFCVHNVELKSVPSEHLYLHNAMIVECTMTFTGRFIFKY